MSDRSTRIARAVALASVPASHWSAFRLAVGMLYRDGRPIARTVWQEDRMFHGAVCEREA